MRSLLLIVALALPASAQRVVEVPALSAGTVVHPTLLGPLGDPGSPLAANLQGHAAQLATFRKGAFFDRHAAASYLERLRETEPLDRVSAGVLSRALEEPETMKQLVEATGSAEDSPLGRLGQMTAPAAASIENSPKLAGLAKAAAGDKEAALLFDGSARRYTGVEHLQYKKDKLWFANKKWAALGQGGFGIVYANPAAEGQVVKFTVLSFEAALFAGADSKKVYDADVETSRYLAVKGFGPRLLAEAVISGHKVAVKERIYGKSIQQLIWDRAYGDKEHAIVLDFIARMAKARVRVGDMNPTNLMLGRTLVDPTPRLYHIDGGEVRDVRPEETEEQLKTSIYHQAALFKTRMGVGVDSEVALSTMLEEGLRRSKERGLWQKFTGFLRDGFMNANFPDH